MKSQKQSWDHVSNWYDNLVGSKGQYYHQHVIFPNALRLLELSVGMNVLDLACGQGVFSRELAAQGCHVIGIDSAKHLIEKAIHYPGTGDTTYYVDDARSLSKIKDKQFDRIVSILAIQNIDPIDELFTKVSSLLKESGTFTVVMLHPAFRSPRITGWGEDEKRHLQYRRVDRYMSPMQIPIDIRPSQNKKYLTWTYHRPLQTYIELGVKNGLCVTALEEWISDKNSQGKNAKMENLAREEIPMFVAIRYQK